MLNHAFPASGWRNRLIRVPKRTNAPALLRLRSRGPVTSFTIAGVIDNAHEYTEYPGLIDSHGAGLYPFVVPTRFTHVQVKRKGREGNGFGRWHLEVLDAQDIPTLDRHIHGNRFATVFWPGERAPFRYEFTHKDAHKWSELSFRRANDGEIESLETRGSIRGTATLPGPGYLQIQTTGEWNIALE